MSVTKLPILTLPIVFAVFLAGCRATPVSQPAMAVSSDACSSATFPKDPPLDSSFASKKVLGGGKLESGLFHFEAYLYCDPTLVPDATEAGLKSDIAELGVHTAWRYDGPDMPGPVELFWGFAQGPQPSGGWDSGLTRGSMAAYTGGIVSAEAASAIAKGDLLHLTFSVKATGAEAGAVLSFDMVASDDGYTPRDIALESLP